MSDANSLRLSDYLVLGGICLVLFGYSVVEGRTLTIHETVHCENVREMLADHDWIIPHYGGRPWLERPPLPHWLTAIPAALSGHPEREWSMRIGPMLAGIFIVLTVGWMAGRWFGCSIGVLSGAILATTREFQIYATAPECDIFLCAVVTAAFACFTAAAFRRRGILTDALTITDTGRVETPPQEDGRFLGWRPLPVVGFFFFVGLTNLAKGLFFGMFHVLVPIGVFLLWNRNWRAVRRHVWLWGLLIFAIVAAAWPVTAYLKQPGIVDLWRSDYLGRLNNKYMPEYGHRPVAGTNVPPGPDWGDEHWWYYFANLPLNLLPWTPLAFAGTALLFKKGWREAGMERFILCWAVVPVLFFSLMQAKHHHYLLHCAAPWAVLGALAAQRAWQYLVAVPRRLTQPWLALAGIGVPVCAFAVVQHFWWPKLLAGPGWLLAVIVAGAPLLILGFTWALRQSDGHRAFAGFFAALIAISLGLSAYRTFCLDKYSGDRAFMQQVAKQVQGQTVYLSNEAQPLEASWFLYYSRQPTRLLQNLTYLRDDSIREEEVYVIARKTSEDTLRKYGTPTEVLESSHSRAERTLDERWALYLLRFDDNLIRVHGDMPISPMQATGRMAGPFLQ
jgi:4-amino-4-deoxy-L-arabinose transferase-like glycosyltransferase